MYGCASSGEATDATATEETSTMSETQTMAGNEATETEVTTDTAATDPIATDTMAAGMETNAMTIIDVAKTKSDISTFLSLVEAAGISAALQGQGEFTMFAPTNKAFEQLPAGQLDYLKKPENKTELLKVLQPHFFGAKVTTAQLQNNQRIQVAENDYIDVKVGTGANDITIGGASIIEPNIEASNGVIHVVDRVLVTADRVTEKE
ncbi:hypothetical protein OB13_06595 [Pontibacter sp. HJ8]